VAGPEILVATDFSRDAQAALACAIELARRLPARIRLLHATAYGSTGVDPYAYLYPVALRESIARDCEQRLAQLCEELAAEGVEAGYEVRMGTPSEIIVEAGGRDGVAMIVMGTRGLGGLSRALFGSVAERVARHARPPVLTVKA
jgi:nucleotide-binding universal stress UspA family protein